MRNVTIIIIITILLTPCVNARSISFLGLNAVRNQQDDGGATVANSTTYVGTPVSEHHHFDQDVVNPTNPNACGTTSLSMVLVNEGLMDYDLSRAQKLDEEVRPWGGFSAPKDLKLEAKKRGLKSVSVNKASFAELEEYLGNGNSVMALVEGGSSPHWIVILGVETKSNGEKTVYVGDPGRGEHRTYDKETFEDKWATPNKGMAGSFLNAVAGYENYLLVFDKEKDNLPKERDFSIHSTEAAADGVSDLANSWSHLQEGQIGTAIGEANSGLINVATALPGVIGSAIETSGIGDSNVPGSQLISAFGTACDWTGNVISGAGSFLGTAYEVAGEKVDGFVGGIVDGFKGLFD